MTRSKLVVDYFCSTLYLRNYAGLYMGLLVLEYCLHNTIISAKLQGLAWLAAGTFRQVKINKFLGDIVYLFFH